MTTQTTASTKTLDLGIVPCGGEFALTNMATSEILSYHSDRNSADRAAVSAMRAHTDAVGDDTASARPEERKIVADMLVLLHQARGDHAALADVRRRVTIEMDAFLAGLASHGVDTAALLEELDPE